jgi:hypothetical protein
MIICETNKCLREKEDFMIKKFGLGSIFADFALRKCQFSRFSKSEKNNVFVQNSTLRTYCMGVGLDIAVRFLICAVVRFTLKADSPESREQTQLIGKNRDGSHAYVYTRIARVHEHR